jgi:hypothetical protein
MRWPVQCLRTWQVEVHKQKQIDRVPAGKEEQVLLLPSELTLSLSLLLAGTQERILTGRAGNRMPKSLLSCLGAAATDFVSQ